MIDIPQCYKAHNEDTHTCFYNEDGYCVGKMIADTSFACRHMVFTRGELIKCGASAAETIDIVTQAPTMPEPTPMTPGEIEYDPKNVTITGGNFADDEKEITRKAVADSDDGSVSEMKLQVQLGNDCITDVSSGIPERICCICGLGSEAGYVASPFATMTDGTSGFIHVHMGCSDKCGIAKTVDEDVMELIEMSGGVQ